MIHKNNPELWYTNLDPIKFISCILKSQNKNMKENLSKEFSAIFSSFIF